MDFSLIFVVSIFYLDLPSLYEVIRFRGFARATNIGHVIIDDCAGSILLFKALRYTKEVYM